ncbi:hypothetical protein CL632_02215 [bacterium]|jgi:AbrB family looped-hinge helix DNA binding protein|nr:hypothetical protein [bacterium]MDP6756413.1 AbrB/MazE/SpoVT family DNA-binding domain-containing protein [Patescibacteria group bacterium]|tara:strand:- start:2703 stop:2882 length:180 start_codon:yes stop_codon:yes gene_type:complete
MQTLSTKPLSRIKTKGQTTVPKEIRSQIGLIEGDVLEWAVEGIKVTIMPKRLIDAAPIP